MAKKTTFSIVPAIEGTKVVGITLDGYIPFEAFSDEKDGNEYTVYLYTGGEKEGRMAFSLGKTAKPNAEQAAQIEAGEVIADERQATAHRDLRKNFSNASIVWPDGKVRDVSFKLKANNPLSPEQYTAATLAASSKRAATTVKNLSKDAKRELMAQLAAELESDEAGE